MIYLSLVSSCIHFLSCIAVFASDERLSDEFGFLIEMHQQMAAVEQRANSNQVESHLYKLYGQC